LTRQISYSDFLFSTINAQTIERGTTVEASEEDTVYFILGIFGATAANPVTIKDSAGVTIGTITVDRDVSWPLRLDDGFSITATGAVGVQYSKVSKGN